MKTYRCQSPHIERHPGHLDRKPRDPNRKPDHPEQKLCHPEPARDLPPRAQGILVKGKGYIAIGSNLNHPYTQIQVALQHLSHLPKTQLLRVSSIYRNPAWGGIAQPDFLNGVACVETELSPQELLQHLKHIEQAQGRMRTILNGPRSIDLDLVLFDDVCLATDELTLPHPRYRDRNFVLIPLFEIAPDLIMPDGVALADLIPLLNQDHLEKINPSQLSSASLDEQAAIIHILGAGAIGCLIAAQLYRSNIAVQLVLKNEEILKQYQHLGGVTCIDNEKKELLPIPATTIDACLAPNIVFITTKAFDVAAALHSIQHALSANSIVILLNNGLGCINTDASDIGIKPLLGMHYCAAIRHAPFVIEIVNISTLYVGHPEAQARPTSVQNLITDIAPSGLHVQWEKHIMQKLWSKLGVNCIINPLTALLQCKNGALLQQRTAQQFMHTIAEEIVTAGQAMGIALALSELLNFAHDVIAQTAQNNSSMLQDILQHRRTEIDYLNGYICQQAKQHALATPYNHALTHLIHMMEHLHEKN